MLKPNARRVFLALLCVLFFSCTDIEHGIFYSIEHEEKTPDNSLPNDIGVYGMVKVPKIPGYANQAAWAHDRYYLAGGALFFRDAAPGSDWKKVSTPGSGGIVNDVAWIDTGTAIEIYVSVMYGNDGRLYRLDQNINPDHQIPDPSYVAPPPPAPYDPPRITDPASTYTAYDGSAVWSGKQIQRLINIDRDSSTAGPDEIFASIGTPTTTSASDPYRLLRFYWNGGLSLPPNETGLNGEIITGGTYDGSDYWFVSHSHVFKLTNTPAAFPAAWTAISSLPATEDWITYTVWEIDMGTFSMAGSNPAVFNRPDQKLSRFEDIFYDSAPYVGLSGINSPNYSPTNANPDLYIACADGLYIATTTAFPATPGTPWDWDRMAGGYYTVIAKIFNNPPTESRLVFGREDSGLAEFEMRSVTIEGGSYQEPYGHHPYGKYTDYPSLYNASITCLLADGPVLIAGTTRSGAWNGDYSDIQRPYWSQE